MSMHSIRAKIRHKNSDIHLGYYQTQAQATAAKAGGSIAPTTVCTKEKDAQSENLDPFHSSRNV